MMRKLAPLALLSILIAACNGEKSPTAVGSVVRLNLVLATTSSHTIQKAKMTFDGVDVRTVEAPGGAGQMTFEGVIGDVKSGAHVIKIIVLQQASSPNPYFAGGAVTTESRVLDLAQVQATLATGEGLSIPINV